MIRRVLFVTLITVVVLSPWLNTSVARAANPVLDLVLEVFSDAPVKIYDRPDFNANVVQNAPYGARMTWNGVMQQINARTWIQVNYLRVVGWASPDSNAVYLADPGKVTPGINPAAIIQPAQRPATLYAAANMSSGVVGQVPVGARLYVADGPVIADYYTWWQVRVEGQNTLGWIPDMFTNLQTLEPLKVYGVEVCDNFKIKIYGAFGWDSIMNEMPNFIPANEKIVCLASSNLRGDGTPFVTVLSRMQNQASGETRDSLRIFEKQDAFWTKLYEETTEPYTRTVDLGLFDLTGDGKPSFLWTVVSDGTGHYMKVRALRYHQVAGIQQILYADSLYKGGVQVAGTGSLVVLQAELNANEANCCPTGLERWGYVWQNNEFVQAINDKLRNPGALQGVTPQ